MKSVIISLLRSPRTVSLLLYDLILVPLWMRLIGVQCGPGCRFVGLPVVKLARGAKIILGKNVLVDSRTNNNPAGLPHPTILAAIGPQSYITIGAGTGISGASITARSSITVGKMVLIGAGACIWDTDFHPIDANRRREHPTRDAACAPIKIEDEVFIGARALLLKGVNVGRGAVVGAGAIVTKSVKPGDIVAGNPARVVRSMNMSTKEE